MYAKYVCFCSLYIIILNVQLVRKVNINNGNYIIAQRGMRNIRNYSKQIKHPDKYVYILHFRNGCIYPMLL